jgi:hypothetical protein
MNDQYPAFTVFWQVRGSMAHPQYSGKVTVFAEDEDDAESRARRDVHRNIFPDLSPGSIDIIRVEQSE